MAGVDSVDIVTRAFDDLGPDYSEPIARLGDKATIRRLRTGNRSYLSKEALEAELPALAASLDRLIAELPYCIDIIHAHFSDAARLAVAMQEKSGIPWVYTPHSLALDKYSDAAARPELRARIGHERASIKRASAIIVSSRDEAERQVPAYEPAAGGRVHRLSPGVTLDRDSGVEAGLSLIRPFLRDVDKPLLLAVARPVRKKNLVSLVEAFGRSSELRRSANLAILAGIRTSISAGSEEQVSVIRELVDRVDALDLWGSVALPRRHTPRDVRSLYSIAARGGVFLNPALHEPFGLTIIEAASAGVPVVATRCGGPADIIPELGYGKLVDPNDPAAIASAALELLNDPVRAEACGRATARAKASFCWSAWARGSAAIYREILTPRVQTSRVAACLFASDMDGTLTGDKLSARVFSRWAAGRSGTGFTIATGRSINEARRVMRDWDLPDPDFLITSVGTEIWRPARPGAFELCGEYAGSISKGWRRERIVELLEGSGFTWQPQWEQRCWKLSFLGDAGDAARIRKLLSAGTLEARVVHSHGELIDVIPARAGKAAALRFEAERQGLTLADCIASGDSGNDIDMLSLSGRAIVPSNARDGIKGLLGDAVFHGSKPHAAGVLEGLRAFGLMPEPSVADSRNA